MKLFEGPDADGETVYVNLEQVLYIRRFGKDFDAIRVRGRAPHSHRSANESIMAAQVFLSMRWSRAISRRPSVSSRAARRE